ncbi:hypothetical protein LSTR_LSTR007817 [Laodelphax striatellus]|uniref:Uncharacterized protein n=1 Tax=Laodelphax striatellus TaxID=195883 RepID=A0A482WMH4_LAOST|nr:hypothetical protein LSTR_LSTR007817 [Laodelphax striatellus]
MVRLSKNAFLKRVADKKPVPFVVSKSIDTSHNIEIALQETKSLALLKSTRRKPFSVIKACLNEFEDSYESRKCSISNVREDFKQTTLPPNDELINEHFYKEKRTVCPFLTPLKSKKNREISCLEHEDGMLPLQNYASGDDLNILSTISSPTEEKSAKTDSNPYFDLEEIWAESMSNLEEKALSSKLCSCILRKQNKLRTKIFEDDFVGNASVGSSLVSVFVQDKYWKIKEFHKKDLLNERRSPEIDQYEQTQNLVQNLSLNHSKSEQLRRCMCEIKQLHDSLKNKM